MQSLLMQLSSVELAGVHIIHRASTIEQFINKQVAGYQEQSEHISRKITVEHNVE